MKKNDPQGILLLIVVIVIGMFMLNEVVEETIKNIGQSAIDKSNAKK